jgi:hypothetical protein
MNEELRKELKELGSSIEPGIKKEGFKVPEAYFESMQDAVLNKLSDSKGRRPRIRILSTWLYASAALIVLLIGTIVVFNTQQQKVTGFEQLDSEAVFAYLGENLEEISWQMLVNDAALKEVVNSDEQDTEILEMYLEENLEELSIEELENLL